MAIPKIDIPDGSVFANRYRVLRPLGTGSMGAVFEVETPDGARFALKALVTTPLPKDAAELRRRFEREATITQSLAHENVCPVLDHGIDEALDVPYLVMPLLVGEDLASVIARAGAVDPAAVVPLFVQASRGLAAAHGAGVIHRDVKPSNLFLSCANADDPAAVVTLKVLDFGLAKVDDAVPLGTLTASNRFMGSPHYVSPEQATSAKRADARSDLWSLAMSMYHALAGVPAFDRAGTFLALIVEVTGSKGVRSVQVPAPWVQPAVARVIHSGLVRDPALRCPSAGELALALEMAVGFDAANAKVTASMLKAVPDATRAQRAPVAHMPTSWADLLRM